MRSRTLKPGFFTNEQLAECNPLARILFAGLWCIADRAGKLHDRPRKIKAEVLPYEAIPDADGLLVELSQNGLIVRYEVGGERYVKIPNFEKHQNPHPKEMPSVIPEPCNSTAEPDLSAASREKDSTSPAGSSVSCFQDLQDLPSTSEQLAASADASPPAPAVAVLPCVGQGPKEYPVVEAQVSSWREAYPGVDVLAEIRKARVWLEARPARRKTYRGMPAFLVSWLNRAQNGPAGGGRDPPRSVTVPASQPTDFQKGRYAL